MARFNVEFNDETLRVLDELASRQGMTKAEVLRRAVHFEKYLLDASNNGTKLLLETDGQLREIVKV